MTLQEIDEMAIIEPYCFENEQEEQWYKVGLREGADAAIKQLGWHPGSELPTKDGEYIVISLPDMYGDTDVFYAEYRQPYGWCYEIEGHYAKINIQKWCYPPEKE